MRDTKEEEDIHEYNLLSIGNNDYRSTSRLVSVKMRTRLKGIISCLYKHSSHIKEYKSHGSSLNIHYLLQATERLVNLVQNSN